MTRGRSFTQNIDKDDNNNWNSRNWIQKKSSSNLSTSQEGEETILKLKCKKIKPSSDNLEQVWLKRVSIAEDQNSEVQFESIEPNRLINSLVQKEGISSRY